MAYHDHYWNDQWSSLHRLEHDRGGQHRLPVGATPSDSAQYASANVLYAPDPRILMGAELLWGEREDFNENKGDDLRIQVSFKYSFSSNDFK